MNILNVKSAFIRKNTFEYIKLSVAAFIAFMLSMHMRDPTHMRYPLVIPTRKIELSAYHCKDTFFGVIERYFVWGQRVNLDVDNPVYLIGIPNISICILASNPETRDHNRPKKNNALVYS